MIGFIKFIKKILPKTVCILYKSEKQGYNESMYIADLHIHSKYSRATSKNGDIPNLDFWARRKGIELVGTGDFTHPAWRGEMADTLEPAEEGLYRIKPEKRLKDFCDFSIEPRFVVSGEISCIYKQDGKVRKVHNLILLPSLDAAERLALKLETIGNIRSDGRPILGLSSKDLLAITLEICPEAIFIPAHIWTPHFSMFGAFSGFDTVEECFGDLAPHIRAMETGLSSDPRMNRRVPQLDRYTLVSNSDAHSPAKLGRESNLIDAELSYPALKRTLDTGEGFLGTVEFFPEEGKYHLDGHRACHLRLTPQETRALGGKCPVCGKKITIGVLNRLEQLAERDETYISEKEKRFEYLMPLPEVIAASLGISASGDKAERVYCKLLSKLGAEAEILRVRSLGDIEKAGGERIAEGIRRLREERVIKTAGYDGEYGKIALFTPDELKNASGQMSFLSDLPLAAARDGETDRGEQFKKGKEEKNETESGERDPRGINAEQEAAADSKARVTAVVAGPGTGKTFTLVERIVRLVESGVKPAEITAVTFTVKAAAEMRERLSARLKKAAEKITVGTFHSICFSFLKDEFALANPAFMLKTAAEVVAEYGIKLAPRKFLNHVSAVKNGKETETDAAAEYNRRLRAAGMLDYDDLISEALKRKIKGKQFRYLHVDEFQDVNPAQYELIRLWLGEEGRLFAIGDPDQAIYSFRGAASDCFSMLAADYPDALTVRLTKNYRSTPEVIDCALNVVSHNSGARVLEACKPSGAAVRLVDCASELSEGIFVAKEIARMTGGLDMLGKGREEGLREFGEIAVLARTHRQLSQIEHCLRRDDIPCVVSGKTEFLEAPAVSGTLAFFAALLAQNEAAEAQALEFMGGRENFEAAKEKFLPLIGGRPRKILTAWKEYLHLTSAEFEELIKAAHYAAMDEFLDAVYLGKEGDVLLPSGNAAAGAVRLATLHGAKGLEFPVVFLCGLTEKVLPLVSSRETDEEEERRLFYVGITRAIEELVLTTRGDPSPFLAELPSNVKREKALEKPWAQQLSLF